MQAKLAILISDRANRNKDFSSNGDPSVFATRYVYPVVAAQAYRGMKTARITGTITPELRKFLREKGYVVRDESWSKDSFWVEWCSQTVYVGSGEKRSLSPQEYNDYISSAQLPKQGLTNIIPNA